MVVDENSTNPSYMRLIDFDGIKKGGGHRVKSLTIHDNWTESATASYTTTYKYRTEDSGYGGREISSGVAENEPLHGKEENTLRVQASTFSNDQFVVRDNAHYIEAPLMFSYYPSANVKYSKVIVSQHLGDYYDANDNTNDNVTTNNPGITVHEFYTAKDYPVRYNESVINTDAKTDIPIKRIPFLNVNIFNSALYTQGYSLVLNDMHGRPESVTTYSKDRYENDPEHGYSSKTTYNYFEGRSRSAVSTGQLSSFVRVYSDDMVYGTKELGKSFEVVHYVNEVSKNQINHKTNTNVDNIVLAIPLIIPYLSGIVGNSKEIFRTIATSKVIYQKGILKEVINEIDGQHSITRNLGFDQLSGQPILTEQINNFGDPVYTYHIPAHWHYSGLEPAYKNYRLSFTGKISDLTPDQIKSYFHVGDIIELIPSGSTSGTTHTVTLVDAYNSIGQKIIIDNSPPTDYYLNNYTYTISKQARTNQTSANAGSIVALTDPTSEEAYSFPLLDTLEAYSTRGELSSTSQTYNFRDCDGTIKSAKICLNTSTSYDKLTFSEPSAESCEGGECEATINLDGNYITNLSHIKKIEMRGGNVTLHYDLGTSSGVCYGTWTHNGYCYSACIDGVLNASATQFDEPDYTTNNIWRPLLSCAFRVAREQQGTQGYKTDIRKDGLYAYFRPFNWQSGNEDNKQFEWRWGSKITGYNTAGFEIENVDALGIYSSADYGYEDALVTALASNARYNEIFYEGFEDYAQTSYSSLCYGDCSSSYSSFELTSGSNLLLTSNESHTGSSCLFVNGQTLNMDLNQGTSQYPRKSLMQNKKYLVSMWVKPTHGTLSNVSITFNSSSISADLSESPVDGWYKVEATITTPNTASALYSLQISGIEYIDDLRIHPAEGNMQSWVYDPSTLRLKATLDANNYASMYNYDEEGVLVQVKKETVGGIKTIQTNRQNVKMW